MSGHFGVPGGDRGVVGGISPAGVGPHDFIEELPRQNGGRVAPTRHDVAVFVAGEFTGERVGEKIFGTIEETARFDIPRIVRPVGILKRGVLAVMLQDHLEA